MYYAMRASAPSLHRESTDSLITSFSLIIITFFGNLNANTKSIKSIDLNIIGGFSATIIPVRHCACIDIASAHEG